MSDSAGIGIWMWLIIAAIFLAGLAIALRRWGMPPFRRAEAGDEFLDEGEGGGRLEVLESTPVDAQRRLLLVRCDNVEHLIMVGGPADLVVESDVRKSRTAGKTPSRQPAEALSRPLPPTQTRFSSEPVEQGARPSAPAAPVPVAALPPEPARAEHKPAAQPAPEAKATQPLQTERKKEEPKLLEAKPPEGRPGEAPPRLSAPSRPTLTAVPGAAVQPPTARREPGPAAPAAGSGHEGRNGAAAQKTDEAGDGRPGRARPHAPEPQIGPPIGPRREAQSPNGTRAPTAPPVPADANGSEERARDQRLPGRGATLPPADSPWPEPDSVENEIVRALAIDSDDAQQQGPPNRGAAQPAPPATAKTDPATTLGDLAERLEEALAREVQSANKSRSRLDPNVDTFSFDREDAQKPAAEVRQQAPQRDRREPAKAMPPAPEPEVRREARPQPERQEDSPVINLHARRREAVDPLEDEMARLLGELTGDTNRR